MSLYIKLIKKNIKNKINKKVKKSKKYLFKNNLKI